MKKTNVSSEVLILLTNREKSAPEWTPKNSEKDECFERGLDFEVKKGGPSSRPAAAPQPFWGPFWGPFWAPFSSFLGSFFEPIFGAILAPFWGHFGAHFGAISAQTAGKTSPRAPSRASKSKQAAFSKTLKNLQFFKVFEVQRLSKRPS